MGKSWGNHGEIMGKSWGAEGPRIPQIKAVGCRWFFGLVASPGKFVGQQAKVETSAIIVFLGAIQSRMEKIH